MVESPKLLTGLVAAVVNDRTVVLNIGSANGVAAGQVFRVLDEALLEVTDPVTGELLESLAVTKAVVKVVDVGKNVSVAQTYRRHRVNVGGNYVSNPLATIFAPPKYEERVETFRYDEQEGKPIEEHKSNVGRGDRVELVPEDQDDDQIVTLQR